MALFATRIGNVQTTTFYYKLSRTLSCTIFYNDDDDGDGYIASLYDSLKVNACLISKNENGSRTKYDKYQIVDQL